MPITNLQLAVSILADVPPDPPSGIDPMWKWLPIGYLCTIAIETPVLLALLSPRHPMRHRLFAGMWLTACTYPAFILSLSQLFPEPDAEFAYLMVGETLVALAECSLFWAAFGKRELRWTAEMWRDMGAVAAANIVSFGLGLWLRFFGAFDWLT